MGLATIDPHSQKEHSEIHKIPKFGVNEASFDFDAVSDSVGLYWNTERRNAGILKPGTQNY